MNAIIQPETVLILSETMPAAAFMASHMETVTNTVKVIRLNYYLSDVSCFNLHIRPTRISSVAFTLEGLDNLKFK